MVRTRIAPSPTGQDIHIGNLYTALINYVYAKQHNGKFIVRIEDTDRIRYVKGSEERILETLRRFGIATDESPESGGNFGPYRQSERLHIYKQYAEELIKKGCAYYCFCSRQRIDEVRKKMLSEKKIPKYDKHCFSFEKCNKERELYRGDKPYVIRLKIPENKRISFHDEIRGEIAFNSNDIDDQILLKSDGYPTYHLAVVVDDYLMNITHVIRAEEWISATPKHVLIYEAMGWKLPIFVHLPILRNPDRSKLSKRKNPVWASWYLEQGFLKEAVLNYLSLMGWSHPKGKEIFSLDELKQVFNIKDIQTVGPVFDIKKLEWMNGEYIRQTPSANLKTQIYEFYHKKYPEDIIEKTIPFTQERLKKLSDYLSLCKFFFKRLTTYEIDLKKYQNVLQQVVAKLRQLQDWKANMIGEAMQNLAKEMNIKNSEFFMMLRVAVTGKKISPPLNESMEILGKKECIARIETLL